MEAEPLAPPVETTELNPPTEGEQQVYPPSYVPHALQHELLGNDVVRPSLQNNGAALNRYRTLNFIGMTITEDPTNQRVNITGATARSILAFMVPAGGFNVNAGSTVYVGPGQGPGSTEANVMLAMPFACTLRNLYVVTSTAQPGTGALTVTVRNTSADTALTVTVVAGGGAGTRSDIVNTAAFAAGNWLSLRVTNAASTNSATIQNVSVEVDG